MHDTSVPRPRPCVSPENGRLALVSEPSAVDWTLELLSPHYHLQLLGSAPLAPFAGRLDPTSHLRSYRAGPRRPSTVPASSYSKYVAGDSSSGTTPPR